MNKLFKLFVCVVMPGLSQKVYELGTKKL